MFINVDRPDRTEDYLGQIEKGKVLVFRNSFRVLGYYDRLVGRIVELIGNKVPAGCSKVQFLENIPAYLSGDQVVACHELLRDRLEEELITMTKSLSERLLGLSDFWINENGVVRMMTPYAHIKRNPAFRKYKGKLDLHDPHLDFHQRVAHNAINYWIPLTAITTDNTLMFFPETTGKYVYTDEEGAVRKDAYLGPPQLLACGPGDVVVFHSQLMHSPVLNTSTVTRWVISSRVTVDRPNHPRHFVPLKYFPSAVVGRRDYAGVKRSYRSDALRLSNLLVKAEVYARQMIRRFVGRGRAGRSAEALVGLVFDPFFRGKRFPYNDESCALLKPPDGTNIRADGRMCSVVVAGARLSFPRFCPHKGADLSNGRMVDGVLYCPWHNYAFDVADGGAGPNGLFRLKVKRSAGRL